MGISVCITVYNEEDSISELIASLVPQIKKQDELIIVDGGSTDDTLIIIKKYSKRTKNIKVVSKRCTRSEGRNISVMTATNNIIAMTDAGCIPNDDWLAKIIHPFENKEIEVVAGYYSMSADSAKQGAIGNYLGVVDKDFDDTFLPSTRSIAFRKKVWEKVGGFPEDLDDTAEDTEFNYRLIKNGVKIERVKEAQVDWEVPDNMKEFFGKVSAYARGDILSGIWYHPTKKLSTHNIKALLVLTRYLFGVALIILSIFNSSFLWILICLLITYTSWSYYKNFKKSDDILVGLWGITIQIISDLGVINGFIGGVLDVIVNKKNE